MGRAQIAVYAAIGIVLLLLGVRAVRDSAEADPAGQGAEAAWRLRASRSAAAPRPPPTATSSSTSPERSPSPGSTGSRPGRGSPTPSSAPAESSGKAAPDTINLAARLADGQQVVVPERSPTGGAAATDPAADGPISLGSADAADLETIEGIGPVTAADILAYRDEHGGVSSIEQLDEIPGIGPTTIEALSDRLQP